MALWKSRINEWRRQEDEIAKRIDADEVRREWMNRPFQVGEGSVSLLFVEGRLEGRLVPGRYDVDGPLSRWKEGDTATTIVMIDTCGLVFELPFEGLVTKEHVPVSVRVRVVLRLSDDEAAPERFWRQVIRDQGTYSKSNLASSIGPVVRGGVRRRCLDSK
jgi:regulator of protease activity HflC (stomatin/prohibitin superfamily)